VDDLDLVVDFSGYRRDKSQNQSQQMTPLWTSISHWHFTCWLFKQIRNYW
jgi:hypothetical protein